MRKKLFDLFRYIISIVFLIGVLCFSYFVLSKTFKGEDIDENTSFHNLPENSMDVIVLGSSHAQYSFSPAFFYQDTGLYSYNLGTQCQPLSVSYTMLKEVLKTQSPKVVILEVFTSMPLKEGCDGIGCYINAGFQMRGEEKYETLKKLPQDKYETYVNPFVSLHNDWRTTELTYEEIKESVKNTIHSLNEEKSITKVSSNFGYIENYPQFPVENSWYATRTDEYIEVELNEEDIEALNNIYDLCNKNNISLILYKTPIDSLDVKNLSYLKKVWDWAEEKGVKYVDFIKKAPQIGYQMCLHSDSFHGYINGSSIIVSNLADVVNELGIEHNINEELEKKYIKASNNFTEIYLKYEYDPNLYFDRLLNFKGTMLIIYDGSHYNSKAIDSFLNKYDINSPSIMLVDNEQIIDRGESCVGINYNDTDIYSDYKYTEIDLEPHDIECGLSVVVFDNGMDSYYQVDTNLHNMWKNGYYWYGE